MDTKDPTENPEIDQEEEVIEISDDILEISDDLIEEIEEEEVKVSIPKPVPPPLPVPPKFEGKKESPSSSTPVIPIADPDAAYMLPFTNKLREYVSVIEDTSRATLIERSLVSAKTLNDAELQSLYLFNAGYLYETENDKGKALKSYASALDKNPPLRPTIWSIRKLLLKRGLQEKVNALFGVEIDQENDPVRKASLLYLKGVQNEELNNFDTAESSYRESLENDPTNFLTLLALFRIRDLAEDNQETAYFACLISENITDKELQSALNLYGAYLLRKISNYDEAEILLYKALELDLTHVEDIWFELEVIAQERGDSLKHVETLKKRTRWLLDDKRADEALAIALETTILMERDLDDSIGAFEWLKELYDSNKSTLLIPRMAYFAWKLKDYTWLIENSEISELFYNRFASLKSGKEIEKIPENLPDLLQNELRLFYDYGRLETEYLTEFIENCENSVSSAPALLLAAVKSAAKGENPTDLLIKSIENSPSVESIVYLFWQKLLDKQPQDAAQLVEAHNGILPKELQVFFRNELKNIYIKLNDYQKYDSLNEIFPDISQESAEETILSAELKLIQERPKEAAILFKTAAQMVENSESSLLLTLEAAKLFNSTGDSHISGELLESFSHIPVGIELQEFLLRTDIVEEKLEEILETRGDDLSLFELSFRKTAKDPEGALGLLRKIDRPEGRWHAARFALGGDDGFAYREIMNTLCNDYPDEKQYILGKLGLELTDKYQEDSLAVFEEAFELSPQSEILYRLYEEQAVASSSQDLFLQKDPPELELYEKIDRNFTMGWFFEQTEGSDFLNNHIIGTSQYHSLAKTMSLMLNSRFGKFDNWIKQLPVDEIAEDISRATIQLMLNDKLLNKTIDGYKEDSNPVLKALYSPWTALTSVMAEIIPHEIISDQFASLVSTNKEFKGKIHKAAAARKVDDADSILPAVLAWSRHAKIVNNNQIFANQEARLVDLLPKDHPRRKQALINITNSIENDENNELLFKAWWRLWTEFSHSTESIEQAFSIINTLEDPKAKVIVFNVLSEVSTGDLLEESANNLDQELLNDESLRLPIEEIENLPRLLSLELPMGDNNSSNPEFGKSKDVTVDKNFWTEDAKLLVELADEMDKETFLLEAARLYLLSDSPNDARYALNSTDKESIHKSLFLFAIALNEGDMQEAFIHIKILAQSESVILKSVSMEMSLLMDQVPSPEEIQFAPEQAVSIIMDLYSKQQDGHSLIEFLKEQNDKLTLDNRFILARLLETDSPDEAIEQYETLYSTPLSEIALLRVMAISRLTGNQDKILSAASLLFKKTGKEWAALTMLRYSQIPSEIPPNPLLVWFATDRGFIDKNVASEFFNSQGIKARFLMEYLLESGNELTDEITNLDPDSLEWDMLWRYRADFLEPPQRHNLWKDWAEKSDSAIAKWWFEVENKTENNLGQEFPLVQLDMVRNSDYTPSDLSNLGSDFQNAISIITSLKGNILSDKEDLFSLSRNRLISLLEKDPQEALIWLTKECDNFPELEAAAYLRIILEKGEWFSHKNWIISAALKEHSGESPQAAWEDIISSMEGDSCSILAWRCSLNEEYTDYPLSNSFLEKLNPNALGRIQLRKAVIANDRPEIMDNLQYMAGGGEADLILKGIITAVVDEEDSSFYKESLSKTGKVLFNRVSWRKEKWTELYSILLNQMDDESISSEVKAKIYSKMAIIDGEGKGDADNEYFTRSALSNIEFTNSYNLLRLLNHNRRTKNLQSEITNLRKLFEKSKIIEDQPITSCELWRLEEMGGMKLPDPEEIWNTVELLNDNGVILWWAFVYLDFRKSGKYLAAYFNDLPDSSMLFNVLYSDYLLSEDRLAESRDILKSISHSDTRFRPLVEKGICLSIKEKTSEDFIFFLNLLVDNFDPQEGKAFIYFIAAMAAEQWDNDDTKAIELYELALNEDINYKDAFLLLYNQFNKSSESDKTAKLLSNQIAVEPDPLNTRRYLRDLGQIYMEILNNEDQALKTYITFLNQVPHDKEILKVVIKTMENRDENSLVTKFISSYLSCEQDPKTRSELFLRLATAYDKTEDRENAVTNYIHSLEINKTQIDVWHRLYELYLAKEEYKHSLRSIKRSFSLSSEISDKISKLILMGNLYEIGFSDKKNARLSYQHAVDIGNGDVKSVKALVEFFDSHKDTISRNIKLDLLWATELKKLEKTADLDSIIKITHYLTFKKENKSASLLCDAAAALGVDKSSLPCDPGKQPISEHILENKDIAPFLFPNYFLAYHRNLFHLISPEIPKVAKVLFADKIPEKKTRISKLPELLDDLLDDFDITAEVYKTPKGELAIYPFDPPIILIPEKMKEPKTKEEWQFLLGGKLLLHNMGLLLPTMLTGSELFLFIGGLIKHTFPQKEFKDIDEIALNENLKIAGKILGKIDQNRYRGLMFEIDSITEKKADHIVQELSYACDQLGYLLGGTFKASLRILERMDSSNQRRDQLIRFIFSTNHFKLRENAVFISMSN
jgi:hypothetical protein